MSDGAGNASTDYADGAVSLSLIILIKVVERPKLLPWAPFCLDQVWSSFMMCAGKFEHKLFHSTCTYKSRSARTCSKVVLIGCYQYVNTCMYIARWPQLHFKFSVSFRQIQTTRFQNTTGWSQLKGNSRSVYQKFRDDTTALVSNLQLWRSNIHSIEGKD